MRTNEVPKMAYSPNYPSKCTKPNCKGSRFKSHEDGWQCLNCMKIIYKDAPLPYIANNRPERVGSYDSNGVLKVKNDVSNDRHFCPEQIDQNDDSEHWVAECITMNDSDFWDWFSDYQAHFLISTINKFNPAE